MRQLSLFKGKRQKGIAPPLPLEFATRCNARRHLQERWL